MNCNKLHVNLEKSCYMYFNNTRKTENTERSNKFVLNISNTSLPQVENIKFLGVINNNRWQAYLAAPLKFISAKLSCYTGRLNRITQFIPSDHHTSLYRILFESYLSYGVSVWGGAKPSKLKPVFKAQKKAICVIFGYREKYIDKFKTCVRARPVNEQKLTSAFFYFIKEHTKPLFKKT